MRFQKALRLLAILPRDPLEFYDRLEAALQARWEESEGEILSAYQPQPWEKVLGEMEVRLGVQLKCFQTEPALSEIESHVRHGLKKNRPGATYEYTHEADFAVARACYVVCRLLRPQVIVETGVAQGVTSAFMLKALEMNGEGILHSIDLPPLDLHAEESTGALIPSRLRHRWRLYRGMSKRILRKLLKQVERVDIFIHDSLHTRANMIREFQTVEPHLANRAILIADDVNQNSVFLNWTGRRQPAYWTTVKKEERRSIFGICVVDREVKQQSN
jgi:predicted O-methyltransferase YrrM